MQRSEHIPADILDEYFDAQVAVDNIDVHDGLSLATAAQFTVAVAVGVGVIVVNTAVALAVVVVTRFSPHALSLLAWLCKASICVDAGEFEHKFRMLIRATSIWFDNDVSPF